MVSAAYIYLCWFGIAESLLRSRRAYQNTRRSRRETAFPKREAKVTYVPARGAVTTRAAAEAAARGLPRVSYL